MTEILDAVQAIGLGVLGLVSLALAAASPFILSWIKVVGEAKVAEAKRAAAEAARAAQQSLVLAGETAAHAVEEEAHVTPMRGFEKAKIAEAATVELLKLNDKPESLSPSDPRVKAVVRAGVQKMRQSLPTPSLSDQLAEIARAIRTSDRPPPPPELPARTEARDDDAPTSVQRPPGLPRDLLRTK